MKLAPPISQSFENKLLQVRKPWWISDEDYNDIKKISGWARLGLTKLPKRYRDTIFYKMEQIKKQMPAQGGQTLRLRRYNKE